MAKVVRTTTELTDDIDGGAADETVSFSLDGTSYEIDLTTANAEALRAAFSSYVGHARKAGRSAGAPRRAATPRAKSGGAAAAGANRTADIRAWARDQGLAVNDRGRISAEITEKYDAAH